MAGMVTTVTPTWAVGQNMRKIVIDWVADDASAEPANGVTPVIDGWLHRVSVVPDGVLPFTNNVVHFVISDSDGATINTGTELDNIANGVTTSWVPEPIPVMGALTVRVQNNAVNSGKCKMILYVSK